MARYMAPCYKFLVTYILYADNTIQSVPINTKMVPYKFLGPNLIWFGEKKSPNSGKRNGTENSEPDTQ